MRIANKRRNHIMENQDFDYILEECSTPDFYEMVISIGGDICRIRCYGDNADDFCIRVK